MEILDRNECVKQYEGLICKITDQFVKKVNMPWEDIKSMAYEGFIIAMDTYDENRSKLTFKQFAGWSIRNRILTLISEECRTVKMSAYYAKKVQSRGETAFTSVGITENLMKPKYEDAYENDYPFMCRDNFSEGDVLQTLYTTIEDNFSTRDCELFYRRFGLKDYSEFNGSELAEYFNKSQGWVSTRLNKILDFIRKNEELCELLATLVNN